MLIGVAGMVGTGKTTLSRALAARFGLQIALESVDADNPWLESFYGGPAEMRRMRCISNCTFSRRASRACAACVDSAAAGFSTARGMRTPRFSRADCSSRA